MLTIRKLTMTYGGRTLFDEIGLTINWGERIALVGPNGAGKSTLFKIVLGEESPDSGQVQRDEYAHVGYLSQESGDPVGTKTWRRSGSFQAPGCPRSLGCGEATAMPLIARSTMSS